jgi:hypothetical protein
MPRPIRGDKLIGPYAKPKVRGSGFTFQPGTLELNPNQFILLDTPAWFAWLEQQLAFRFEQVYYVADLSLTDPLYLSYTVRPERRQRGPVYWYAYKKYHNQRLRGTYLGKTKNVTLAHLDQLALQFLSQINPVFYQQVHQMGLVRFRKVPPPDPNLKT